MQSAEHHGLPLPTRQLFRHTQLVEFLFSQVSYSACATVCIKPELDFSIESRLHLSLPFCSFYDFPLCDNCYY